MAARFADTFYWIALTDLNDSAHQRALAIASDGANSALVTTDDVLVAKREAATGITLRQKGKKVRGSPRHDSVNCK
jgi:predicted nucleic acid-binding protein